MAVEFRCEQCGTLLRVEAGSGAAVRCCACGGVVRVPAGLAKLPRPLVPGFEAEGAKSKGGNVRGRLGRWKLAGPWAVSVLLHAALGVALLFVVVLSKEPGAEDAIIPSARLADGSAGKLSPVTDELILERPDSVTKAIQQDWAESSREMQTEVRSQEELKLIGLAGGSGGSMSAFKLTTGGGLDVNFYDVPMGNVHHVVYLVDISGSMIQFFDLVRYELLRSIGDLSAEQTFQVIYFGEGQLIESPRRGLAAATVENKRKAARDAEDVRPEYENHPLPALRRAFAVLSGADRSKRGKLIYLLSDGFAGHDRAASVDEQVLDELRRLNVGQEVLINTIFIDPFGDDGGRSTRRDPDRAEGIMKKIAEQHGGVYRLIRLD